MALYNVAIDYCRRCESYYAESFQVFSGAGTSNIHKYTHTYTHYIRTYIHTAFCYNSILAHSEKILCEWQVLGCENPFHSDYV